MTLVSDIITRAYRESNLIPIGTTPTAAEQAEGLYLLQDFLLSIYGNEAGEQLDTMPIGRENIFRPSGYPWYDQTPDTVDWYVPSNTRLALNLDSPLTVYLDPAPVDGQRFALYDKAGNLSTNPLTVVANGRTIEGSTSKVFNTNGQNVQYIYRDDLGDWLLISPIGLTGTWPFPDDFNTMFTIGLAFRLNPRNSVSADPQTVSSYTRSMRLFSARYRQHREVGSELALIRTPGVHRRYLDSSRFAQSAFNSGYAFPFGYRFLG